MLDGGGGAGYAGTNWNSVSMIDMWLAIGNQETTPHWELLSGWRKSYELTLQHMAAVKSYRDNLAAAWPPETSPASAAYIQRLDDLIAHLQQTYDAAVANHGAFNGATLALSSARRGLEKVVNEYLANEGKLAAFEQEQAAKPRGGSKGSGAVQPPVPDGRQAELEAQARTIMFGLSSELSQARTQIMKPTLYEPTRARDREETLGGGGDYSAPTIPPVVPFDPANGSPSRSAVLTANPPIQASGSHVVSPSSSTPRMPGLVLGGFDSPVAPPPTTGTSPPVVGGTPPATAQATPVPPPYSMPPIAGTGRGLTNGIGRSSMGTPNGVMRAMPPGGIIGTVSGGGLGQPATGARVAPQANPVGGLINPANSQSRPGAAGRPTPAAGQPIGNPVGRNSESQDQSEHTKRWDPDNPWKTAEGVSPVVRPPAESRIDPGPAIGLR